MSKHTPEAGKKIICGQVRDIVLDEQVEQIHNEQTYVLLMDSGWEIFRVRDAGWDGCSPNIDRLQACWNACKGINPKVVPEILVVLRRVGRRLQNDAKSNFGMRQIDCRDLGHEVRTVLDKARGV